MVKPRPVTWEFVSEPVFERGGRPVSWHSAVNTCAWDDAVFERLLDATTRATTAVSPANAAAAAYKVLLSRPPESPEFTSRYALATSKGWTARKAAAGSLASRLVEPPGCDTSGAAVKPSKFYRIGERIYEVPSTFWREACVEEFIPGSPAHIL